MSKNAKLRIVVLSGAGMSAESGIATFRDADGLWAKYRIEDVCTPDALLNNRAQVVEFYNMRRKEVMLAQPNEGHFALAEMERDYDVQIVTQNIDDLHERAGSTNVLHLHGHIRMLRSSDNDYELVELKGWEQPLEARHPDGSLLRPHVVFFGESVPMLDVAARLVARADVVVVVGTSMQVYPAASLIRYAPAHAKLFLIDPATQVAGCMPPHTVHLCCGAAQGMQQLRASNIV